MAAATIAGRVRMNRTHVIGWVIPIAIRSLAVTLLIGTLGYLGWPGQAAAAGHSYSGWWLPPNIGGDYSQILDRVFYIILVVTSIGAAGFWAVMLYSMIRFRDRPGRKAWYIKGNLRMDIVFIVLSAMLWMGGELFVMGEVSKGVWDTIKLEPPPGAFEIEVLAEQFAWNIRYPGADGQFGKTDREYIDEENPFGLDEDDAAGEDDIVTIGEFHVPVGRPVVVRLHSKDVIHSFFIPVLRIKWDALPREPQTVWFEAVKTGSYQLACAELCGLGHSGMKARLVVESEEQVRAWLEEQKEE